MTFYIIHVINGLLGTILTYPARCHPERVMDARTNSKTCADIAIDVCDINDADVRNPPGKSFLSPMTPLYERRWNPADPEG